MGVFLLLFLFCGFTDAFFSFKRPQTPQRPFPYVDEDVVFVNAKAGVQLAGTLTYQNRTKHRYCVVLAHASGGFKRDEEIAGHKIFMVVADYLTKRNIVVLRFDERGLGQSTGNFDEAKFTDFSDDVLAGIDFMKKRKEFKRCRFGIVGHSKGGITAMLAASSSSLVKYIVLLAAPGIDASTLFLNQVRAVQRSMNVSERTIDKFVGFSNRSFELVKNIEDKTKLKEELVKNLNTILNESDDNQIMVFMRPWFKDLLLFNASKTLQEIKIPVLGIYGSLDLHVEPDANMNSIKNALKRSRNHHFKLILLNRLNHLFQTAVTGSPTEFGLIEETISPTVLEIISKWIKHSI